ncbi:hypothetical protein H3S87_05630 [Bifidobacterium sp. W8108]|nr:MULTISPECIES: hypothetical protein [unclassified Bifidobacterium]MBH9979134.1 hypothetical protein [Bifidobacterium sp. W8108]MBI0172994.1 hypothetical protein [Bifidobacterium sp. M0307]
MTRSLTLVTQSKVRPFEAARQPSNKPVAASRADPVQTVNTREASDESSLSRSNH